MSVFSPLDFVQFNFNTCDLNFNQLSFNLPRHTYTAICLNTLTFSLITSSLERPQALEHISKKSLESLQVGFITITLHLRISFILGFERNSINLGYF